MKHTVEEITLKNGAKGLLIHVADATVMNVYINFRAGEYLVARKKWETPHLMEHIVLGRQRRWFQKHVIFRLSSRKTALILTRQLAATT